MIVPNYAASLVGPVGGNELFLVKWKRGFDENWYSMMAAWFG
jgi:hypothetical protein